jgi:hypothetical protein
MDDMRGGPDETHATRSRGAQEPTTRQEQTTRSTRSRTIQGDDVDVPTTRSSRARGERRDERREGRDERRDERRIVIERPAEQERSYAREEKPRLPFPFFFFGNND